jgi:hypothetical protein
MSESIRLAVRPETAHLAPGGRLVFLFALENTSSVAEHCLIAVRGLRADWYSLDRPSVLLGPGVSTSVRLAVHLPDAPVTVGRYPIVVQVVSEDTSTQRTSRDIEVIVDVGGVRMDLQPTEVAGRRGTLHVTLRNDTEQSESVALLAHSDDEARIRMEPAGPIIVPGGGTASALVHVAARPPRGRRPGARWGAHEIEVRGVRAGRESVDDPLLVRHARFIEGARPIWLESSGWRAAIGIPLLALALALFAGVVLLRPRSSHAPRPIAALVALGGVAPGVFPTRNPTFPLPAAVHDPVRVPRRPHLATGSVAAGPLAASATPSRPTPSPHVVLPARPTPSPHVVLPARPTPFRTPTPHAQPVARDAAAPSPRPRVRVASVDRARHTAPLRVRAARSILTMARARPSVRRTASALHGARVSVGTQGRTRRRVTGVRVGTASSHVRRGRVARGVPRHSARGVPRHSARGVPRHSARGVPRHSARGVPRHSARGVQGGTRRRPPQRSVVRGVGRRQTYAPSYRTHLRRGGRPAVADVRRTVLRVAWPSDATLRFSHLETLRLTAAPGALIVVTLRVRVVDRGVGGRRIAQIYRYTTQARADHFGRAALPLRYAYVPTQPASGSLAVVAYAGRTVTRRSARIVLVYR